MNKNVKIMPSRHVGGSLDSGGGEDLISDAFLEIIKELGENPSREGLEKTPARAAKAMRYLTSGYETKLEDIVNGALFDVKTSGMVIVRDIEFYSLCEHHMLPFFGKMHVAYLPNQKVIGLSKIPRIVDMFARRLQVQEQLTDQVAQAVVDILAPRGVGVIAEARHFCMMMRGVEKQHSGTITSTMLGDFRAKKATRDEFLSLVSQKTNPF
ncbi:MAG TPA: GTP cyclohydrolase I FolE [Bryobacteraceae bacterium]